MDMRGKDFCMRLAVCLWMALSLLCLALIAGGVARIDKGQDEVRHYLLLLYNDYEDYD